MTQQTLCNETDQVVKGNTKTLTTRNRKYVFTTNNPTENDIEETKKLLSNKAIVYVVGLEKSNTNDTPHLQGYMRFKNAIAFKTLKKAMPKSHIEVAKGTDDQNYKYCSKESILFTNMKIKESFKEMVKKKCLLRYANITWKEWQKNILDIIKENPDERSIYWIYDRKGNSGKTFLCKYISLTRNVIIADGKKDNIFNQVKTSLDNEILPEIVLVDIPRSSFDFINYGAIEKCKDGFMYSGKYEGGQCIFPSPHVLIFANEKPNKEQMSYDRWKIIKI